MCHPRLSLVYFDFGGRAEATRLALFLADIPFSDVRVPYEGFSTSSEGVKYPYAMLPVLEVDGIAIAESIAMLRYVGRLAGLYPANDSVGAMLIDEILEMIEIFTEKCLRWERESDAANQQLLEIELVKDVIPQSFYDIDAKLEAMKQHATFAQSPPSTIFIHDLVLRSFVKYIIRPDWERFVPDTSKLMRLLESIKHVESHPKIHLYYTLKEQHDRIAAKPLKLTDVNAPESLGEPIRFALTYGGIRYEDERLQPSRLRELKLTLGDGREITKYFAILRYVGTLTGLYPAGQDPLLSFKVDELLSQLEEMQNWWYFPSYTTNEVIKQRLFQDDLVDKVIPKFLGQLDRRIASWAKPYATGSTLTIADLAIFGMMTRLQSGKIIVNASMEGISLDKYENLLKIYQLVELHPAFRLSSNERS